MNIANMYFPAEPDSNDLFAELPGTDPAAGVVIIGAHLDSWHTGTGATDNAAGCAVMMEAMRILKALDLKTRRTIRLALWTGAEQGFQGSRAYDVHHYADPAVMQVKPDHAGVSAYFNMDGGTGRITGIAAEGNAQAAAIFERWLSPFRGAGMTTVAPGSAGLNDHSAFDAVGIPGFMFLQDPLAGERPVRHSNMDTYDRLRPADLVQNAIIVAAFAYQAANRPDPLPRKPLPKPVPPPPGR
jgi:Zn-dependent M28 family amino/carboxypeptidase